AVEEELARLRTQARERAQEADLMRFGLNEVAAVDPQPGEDVELRREEDRLAHADALRTAAEQAHAALAGDPDLTAVDAADAAGFSAAVSTELSALAMPQAVVEVALRRTEQLGRNGIDEVEIQLRPHSGAPARPLQKGASGGELSRVMLALEVVLAGAEPVP